MKQFISALFIAFIALTASAQKDVTKFMGIPVDGTKSEMIQKLKAKGFICTSYKDGTLKGTFNGEKVILHIVTNGDKVWRICVEDQIQRNETDIKIRFNKLCDQFSNNSKYLTTDTYYLSEDENIMIGFVLNKRYQATYYQKNTLSSEELAKKFPNKTSAQIAALAYNRPVWFMIDQNTHKYIILMYYDNVHNQANGEDL